VVVVVSSRLQSVVVVVVVVVQFTSSVSFGTGTTCVSKSESEEMFCLKFVRCTISFSLSTSCSVSFSKLLLPELDEKSSTSSFSNSSNSGVADIRVIESNERFVVSRDDSNPNCS
jgi:hypothetical protein